MVTPKSDVAQNPFKEFRAELEALVAQVPESFRDADDLNEFRARTKAERLRLKQQAREVRADFLLEVRLAQERVNAIRKALKESP